MRLLRVVGAACLLALGGCAAALPRSVPPAEVREARSYPVPVRVVQDLVLDAFTVRDGRVEPLKVPSWGITTADVNGTATALRLDAGMAAHPTVARMVAAHEIGHMLLQTGKHYPDDPWMQPSIHVNAPLVTEPTEEMATRAAARSAGRTYVLVVLSTMDPVLREAVDWAAGAWNKAIGRAVVVVRVEPVPVRVPVPEKMPTPTERG